VVYCTEVFVSDSDNSRDRVLQEMAVVRVIGQGVRSRGVPGYNVLQSAQWCVRVLLYSELDSRDLQTS